MFLIRKLNRSASFIKDFTVYIYFFFLADALNDYLEAPRPRRSENNEDSTRFFRAVRRTLPFQLVPQPPLAYARSNNYAVEPQVVAVNTELESEGM